MRLLLALFILLFVYVPYLSADNSKNGFYKDEMESFIKDKEKAENQYNKAMKGKKNSKVDKKNSNLKMFKTPVTVSKKVFPVSGQGSVPDPVAEYLFTGNADDTSGNNNHAVVNNAQLTPDRGGNEDSAYIFYDRSHRIKIPLKPENTFSTGSFTASFWVKTKDQGAGQKGLLTNESSASTPLWGFNYNNGMVHFRLKNQDGQSALIAQAINDNRWHQVTGVRNAESNTMSLYVDGRLIDTRAGISGSLDSGAAIWVGDHRNLMFTGRIDDIRLWNEALDNDALETIHARSIGQPVFQTAPLTLVSAGIPDPVAKYMFNGNADDTSGNNNHGIVTGAELIQDRVGNIDRAYLFYERPHRIKIPLIPANTFASGSFTASFWVKTQGRGNNAKWLLTNDAGTNPFWAFRYTSDGRVIFTIRNQEGDSTSISHQINDGKWHHITGTRNSYNNTISLYVDSDLVQTKNSVTGSVNSLGNIWIGDHKNLLFLGRIDDVMLWDKPFTENQLRDFHAASATSVALTNPYNPYDDILPDPVGDYRFDGDASDYSSQNNHGIITAAYPSNDRLDNENSCYCFSDRNNRIKIPLVPANTFSNGSFTVSFWLKINDTNQGALGIVTNDNNSYPVWGFFHSSTGEINFMIRNKENQYSYIRYPIDNGRWYKITGIRNASNNTISLYIGSKLVGTKSGVSGDVNSGNSIWIGEHTNRIFEGCIDDVVLWRRAFTAREMKEINSANIQYSDPTNNNKLIKKLNKDHLLQKF